MMEDMYIKKKINLLHQSITHSFKNNWFVNYEQAGLNFQNIMDNMHKGMAYQIYNSDFLKKDYKCCKT